MNICVIGAGAIGTYIGIRLIQAGEQVTVLARGETARVLKTEGWTLVDNDEAMTVPVTVIESLEGQSPYDLVIIALKEPSLRTLAPALGPLIGPDTLILPAMNGVLWWFFEGFGGALEGYKLSAVDPAGQVSANLPTSHVIGCVVHIACSHLGPGKIQHATGNHLYIGEPHGRLSDRVTALETLFKKAGINAIPSSHIQTDVWYKLWGNMTMNPISALTGANCDRILDAPLTNAFIISVMEEAQQVGKIIGCPIDESGADRNKTTRKLGAFKTSMLQDLEANKPLEIDALLTAVREIAQQVNVKTPHMDALLGLVSLLGETKGLYTPSVPLPVS